MLRSWADSSRGERSGATGSSSGEGERRLRIGRGHGEKVGGIVNVGRG